jgi:predicted nucleic acid-binding protein
MIVVADTSPFVVLVAIGHVDVLATDFWISHKLLDERLALFLERKRAR